MARVYQNAVAPEAYTRDDSVGASGFDMSTISAASLHVRKPDGTTTTWTASISLQTATSLRLTHTYAGGDVALVGTYIVWAVYTVPGGTIRSKPRVLVCKAEGDFS